MKSTYIVGAVVVGGMLLSNEARADDNLELGKVRVQINETKAKNLKTVLSQAALARIGASADASFRVELHVTRSEKADVVGYEVRAVIVDAASDALRHVVKTNVRAKVYSKRPFKSSRIEKKAALAATRRAIDDALELVNAQYAMVDRSPDLPKRSTT